MKLIATVTNCQEAPANGS